MHLLLQVCLSAGLLLCVLGVDPTTICYTPVFTSRYFNIISEDHGRVTVDFSKQLYAEVSDVTGIRYVHDFTDLKSYAIREEDNNVTSCKTAELPQSQVMHQCLPPYAKYLPLVTGTLGYASSYKLPIQSWEVETDYDTINRISFTTYSSGKLLPLFLQQYGYHGVNSAYIYITPSTAISDKTVFELPPSCNKDANPLPTHVLVR